jgi:hypothetical protein
MSRVRVLVGTRKGAFVLTSDGKRQRWDVSGPHFGGWEIYHLKGSPADPERLYASQSSGWFGQVIQRSDDGGKTWEPVGNRFVYDGVLGTHLWYDGTPHPWEFARVWHLEPSPTDPDTVYAGVEDAALFRSADAGRTWQELPGLRRHPSASSWQPGAGGMCLHTILFDPRNLERIFIAINKPHIFIGLLIGGSMPFLFSAMTIRAVSRAAFYIINEVRRQFREIPGLMEGREGVMPESGKVVDICTGSAIRELVGPGILAVLAPIIVGCWFGWEGLGGFLAGIIVTGQLMAVLMCNAGGAWDNAKKIVETEFREKGTPLHAATVVGDTVGDPFKDTSSVAMNPIIKFSTLFGLLAVELAVTIHADGLRWGLAAVFFAIALCFVYRSFYGMRIHSGSHDESTATSAGSHGTSRSNSEPHKRVADPVYK